MPLAAAVIGLARAASAADSITLLDGVTRASDLAVGGGHVFVAASDRIVVADTQGTPTTAITRQPQHVDGAVGASLCAHGRSARVSRMTICLWCGPAVPLDTAVTRCDFARSQPGRP
jgi:hypothetical protein